MKKKLYLLFFLIFLLLSCKNKAVQPAVQPFLTKNEQICVLFGNGFNDENFVNNTVTYLNTTFNLLNESEKKIKTLIFPNDFLAGKTARISFLEQQINQNAFECVILLGAPENTHTVLSKIKTRNFLLFSLFPQDDLLGQSFGADFVLDFYVANTETEESNSTLLENDIHALVESLIRFGVQNKPLQKAGEPLKEQIASIIPNTWNINYFVDQNSNLKAGNCFIIDKK